jgi:hypothetical protein
MVAILHGLTLIGFGGEAAEIEGRWSQLIDAARSSPDADYRRCFPKRILESVAEKALIGVRGMNCRIAEPSTTGKVHDTLNRAWKEFWRDPDTYVDWKKRPLKRFGESVLEATLFSRVMNLYPAGLASTANVCC